MCLAGSICLSKYWPILWKPLCGLWWTAIGKLLYTLSISKYKYCNPIKFSPNTRLFPLCGTFIIYLIWEMIEEHRVHLIWFLLYAQTSNQPWFQSEAVQSIKAKHACVSWEGRPILLVLFIWIYTVRKRIFCMTLDLPVLLGFFI